jgi:hypothetical protein
MRAIAAAVVAAVIFAVVPAVGASAVMLHLAAVSVAVVKLVVIVVASPCVGASAVMLHLAAVSVLVDVTLSLRCPAARAIVSRKIVGAGALMTREGCRSVAGTAAAAATDDQEQ